MKNRSIFEPRDLYFQCRSDYSNISCLDNPVWQAHSFWNGAGIGLAASKPGLFISQNARLNNATSRNHPAHTAAHPTKTFRTPFANPCQDGQATCKHGSQAIGLARQDASGLPVASAAIPPAAFIHTKFNSSACPVAG